MNKQQLLNSMKTVEDELLSLGNIGVSVYNKLVPIFDNIRNEVSGIEPGDIISVVSGELLVIAKYGRLDNINDDELETEGGEYIGKLAFCKPATEQEILAYKRRMGND